MTTRISKHITFLLMSKVLSEQSTCARRKVGAILVDSHNRIVGSGYNGNAKGMPHCIDLPCSGALMPPGTGLDKCEAIHAEQNAIMQCSNIDVIQTAYITHSPCMHCLKMLLNTNCQNIYFCEHYANSVDEKSLWTKSGRAWTRIIL